VHTSRVDGPWLRYVICRELRRRSGQFRNQSERTANWRNRKATLLLVGYLNKSQIDILLVDRPQLDSEYYEI